MRHLKRRSIRLKGYDYSRPGAYYITLCTNGREPLFGEIKNGEMILNDLGKTVAKCWNEIPAHFLNVTTDAFVIMPDHVHGILFIDSVNTTTGADDICVMADDTNVGANNYSPLQPANTILRQLCDPFMQQTPPKIKPGTSRTIGSIVRGFKIGVSKWSRNAKGEEYSPGRGIWQRNYYEHIIRDENELNIIRQYIVDNPKNPSVDENYYAE